MLHFEDASRRSRVDPWTHARRVAWLALLGMAVVLLLSPPPAAAQVAGSISGVARDPSGAALAGVTVTVRGPALQRDSLTVSTGTGGRYRLSPIPAGVYD